MIMRIYRVEGTDGKGIYNSGDVYIDGMAWAHTRASVGGGDITETHPSVSKDVKGFRSGMLSGLESKEALAIWFDGYLDQILESNRILLKVYNIPAKDVFKGEHQVAFWKRDKKGLVLSKKFLRKYLTN